MFLPLCTETNQLIFIIDYHPSRTIHGTSINEVKEDFKLFKRF